jgi:replicative DNA helicase Mcm
MIGSKDEDGLFQMWLDLFTLKGMIPLLRNIADNFPEQRSVTLQFDEILKANGELAEMILHEPEFVLGTGEAAILSLLESDQRVTINLRIASLMANERIKIRDLRAENLSKFVSIEGLVRKVTEVRPKLLNATFSCGSCNFRQEIIQDSFSYTEPLECPKDEGGCGKRAGSTSFKFIVGESRFMDSQKIEIQESPEGLRGGDQPQRITVYLEDDLCGRVSPGDRVTVTGTLKAKQRKEGQSRSVVFDLYIQSNHVHQKVQVYEEMELTEEDIAKVKNIAGNIRVFRNVVDSIAPSIFGLTEIKEAMALQLFGGVQKDMEDGTRVRGDIHVLLVGDPGTAKSQMLFYMSNLSPRGIFTSGKSSSAAGLTAAVVKDEFGEGRYTLEAGAMVLADKGLACIDELDKMEESDRSAMHEAMEQQTVSIAKAGILSTLQSRCSVLGAANPKHGRFRSGVPKHEQINLPAPLRSRFDLIFTITDVPDPTRDRELATAVVRRHWLGELRNSEQKGDKTLQDLKDRGEVGEGEIKPLIPKDDLRKFVAYSKKECDPVLSNEAKDEIVDYYVNLRERNSSLGSEGDKSVALTARQLEALIRMTEASARIRLDHVASKTDAKIAIELMEYSLDQIAKNEEGKYDIDGIMGSGFLGQREKIGEIMNIIKELDGKGAATRSEIIRVARDRNIDEDELTRYLKKLIIDGAIYEPSYGVYHPI